MMILVRGGESGLFAHSGEQIKHCSFGTHEQCSSSTCVKPSVPKKSHPHPGQSSTLEVHYSIAQLLIYFSS